MMAVSTTALNTFQTLAKQVALQVSLTAAIRRWRLARYHGYVDEPMTKREENTLFDTLSEAPLLSRMSPGCRQALAQSCALRRYRDGAMVARHGDKNPALYIPCTGAMHVVVALRRVSTVALGDIVGLEMLLGLESSWSYSLEAQSGLVAVLTQEAFFKVYHHMTTPLADKVLIDDIRNSYLQAEKLPRGVERSTRSCELFQQASPSLAEDLDRHLIRKVYISGQVMFEEDDDSPEVFLLFQGRVRIIIGDRRVTIETVCVPAEGGYYRRTDSLHTDHLGPEFDGSTSLCGWTSVEHPGVAFLKELCFLQVDVRQGLKIVVNLHSRHSA